MTCRWTGTSTGSSSTRRRSSATRRGRSSSFPELPISASCMRVPVVVGHAEAVWIETEEALSPEEATALLSAAPGITVVDLPTPGKAAGRDDVLAGRVRRDPGVENGLCLLVVGDNLRKGAALNAIQIAELVSLKPRSRPGGCRCSSPGRAGGCDARTQGARVRILGRLDADAASRDAGGTVTSSGLGLGTGTASPARRPRAAGRARRRCRRAPAEAAEVQPTSSIRPALRSVRKPRSARKSRGKTVRWTRKRSYIVSPSRNAYENVSSAAAPRSRASPMAARKSDCITHGVDGSAR